VRGAVRGEVGDAVRCAGAVRGSGVVRGAGAVRGAVRGEKKTET